MIIARELYDVNSNSNYHILTTFGEAGIVAVNN